MWWKTAETHFKCRFPIFPKIELRAVAWLEDLPSFCSGWAFWQSHHSCCNNTSETDKADGDLAGRAESLQENYPRIVSLEAASCLYISLPYWLLFKDNLMSVIPIRTTSRSMSSLLMFLCSMTTYHWLYTTYIYLPQSSEWNQWDVFMIILSQQYWVPDSPVTFHRPWIFFFGDAGALQVSMATRLLHHYSPAAVVKLVFGQALRQPDSDSTHSSHHTHSRLCMPRASHWTLWTRGAWPYVPTDERSGINLGGVNVTMF